MTLSTLHGWGRTARSRSVVRPAGRDEEMAEAVTRAGPNGVIARGLGRAYGDAAGNEGGLVLDMTARDRVLAFDPASGVVVVEAGVRLHQLLSTVVPAGWFPPVLPGTGHVTVGGAIAADVHGKNHHAGGGTFSAHVLSIDLLTADGAVRTVSPQQQPRLFWATAGGMGLTGVVLRATLRLRRVRSSYLCTRTERVRDLAGLLDRLTADGAEHAVAWLRLSGRSPGAGIVIRGRHAEPERLDPRRRAAPLGYRTGRALPCPPVPGRGLIHRWTVAPFDAVWLRRAPARPTNRIATAPAFFFPLDRIAGWNRAYGRRGFVQYQFVVPPDARDVVDRALRAVIDARRPCFLPVLKAFGPAGPGPLSFPMPGWALSVDLPNTAGLPRLLERLDELVCGAGGRVYLAKDSRVPAPMLNDMYPRLAEFRALRRAIDPNRVFVSDLARRLGL